MSALAFIYDENSEHIFVSDAAAARVGRMLEK